MAAETDSELSLWIMEIDRALSWNNKGLFFKFFFKYLEDCLSLSSSERGNYQPPMDSKSLNSNESANC